MLYHGIICYNMSYVTITKYREHTYVHKHTVMWAMFVHYNLVVKFTYHVSIAIYS